MIQTGIALCNPSGDPHYRTFDGKTYEYQGTCKLNLASPCSSTQQPYFNVFTKNVNRPNVSSVVSFPSYVEIVYNNDTVRISSVDRSAGLSAALTVRQQAWMIVLKYECILNNVCLTIQRAHTNVHFINTNTEL